MTVFSLGRHTSRRALLMRRRLLIGVCFVVVFAAGVGLGIFVKLGVAKAVLNVVRGVTGDGAPGPPAPPLEDWRYPGALEHGITQGMSLDINGQEVIPAPVYALWATADDYDKVVAFYAGKGGFKHTSGQDYEWKTGGETNVVLGDNYNPERNLDGSDKSRPIRALCLRRRCASYDLAVLITRSGEEGHTHIVLLYEPR
jgi:hypothetical protein